MAIVFFFNISSTLGAHSSNLFLFLTIFIYLTNNQIL